MQLTNVESSSHIPFTTVELLNRTASSKTQIPHLQLSTTSSDCVLQTQIPLVNYNRQLLHRTASSKTQIPLVIYNCQLLHRTASSQTQIPQSSYLQLSITSSDCVLLQAADVGMLGTFTFASIIP